MCLSCLRAQSACICHWVRPVAGLLDVLILQHPLEVGHSKGSARLLHLSLPNSCMLTGEVFDEKALMQPGRQDVLLYPETPVGSSPCAPRPLPVPLDLAQAPAAWRLVVIDGTWRKSRKMLHLNPYLRRLPRLSLQGLPASSYAIRKAHRPDHLSTLEATCAALIQLGHEGEKFTPLLTAFAGFVAEQASCPAGLAAARHEPDSDPDPGPIAAAA